MGITLGAKRIIEEKYSTRDQKILSQNIYIKDFPLSPPGLYLKTNNFVQQGLNRILAYYPTDKKWLRAVCGSDGGLLLSQDSGTAGAIRIQDREMVNVTVLDGVKVPTAGIATHVGEDVSGYNTLSVLVSSSSNSTIYIQGSHDNSSWFDYKTIADANVSFSCNNEKIWFRIDALARYIRIVVYATAASTVTVVINGSA